MTVASPSIRWTAAGLLIALFGIPAIVTSYHAFGPGPANTAAILLRELSILSLTAFLLWIVVSRERQPLSSIGISAEGLVRSLAWGVGLAAVAFAAVIACLAAYSILGVRYGEGAVIARSLPVTLLTVVRAGISEEVFYRGYAIERLQALSGSRWLAAAISLAAFAGFHYRQGAPGIVLALVLGAIITGFYLWKRNLLAAILAHFLVDFVPNVLLPLLGMSN